MKRLYLMVVGVVLGALTFANAALAQTTVPSAPAVDVYAYATGVFDALGENLTQLLIVAGLFAGTMLILRMVGARRRVG